MASPAGSDGAGTAGDLAWLCAGLATYLQVHGRAGEALPLFERALEIDEAVYGPDHPHSQTIRRNLAACE